MYYVKINKKNNITNMKDILQLKMRSKNFKLTNLIEQNNIRSNEQKKKRITILNKSQASKPLINTNEISRGENIRSPERNKNNRPPTRKTRVRIAAPDTKSTNTKKIEAHNPIIKQGKQRADGAKLFKIKKKPNTFLKRKEIDNKVENKSNIHDNEGRPKTGHGRNKQVEGRV